MHALAFFLAIPLAAATFLPHEIATGLKGGYQVIAVDMNHDGKPDLIALAPGTNELVWFENPGWQRHVIVSNIPRMINCAAWDIDGDGIPEIALAYEFSNNAPKSQGIVAILHHATDPAQPWTVTEIDRLPTSHRLRWADIHGNGKKVLINAPLTNEKSQTPEDRLPVPLVYYDPADWKRRLISQENEGVQHGIFITDWDSKGSEAILTASFSGIHLYRLEKDGNWSRTEITKGAPAPWPKCGASDVAVGYLGSHRFLSSIEPWHGNQVAIYTLDSHQWTRQVIDDFLADGHTIVTADLDKTGKSSVVAGARAGSHSLSLFTFLHHHWTKQIIDRGKMAAAACVVVDLNADRRPDFACISPVTQNLKWFENIKE